MLFVKGKIDFEVECFSHGQQKNADAANEVFNDEYAITKGVRLLQSYEEKCSVSYCFGDNEPFKYL